MRALLEPRPRRLQVAPQQSDETLIVQRGGGILLLARLRLGQVDSGIFVVASAGNESLIEMNDIQINDWRRMQTHPDYLDRE